MAIVYRENFISPDDYLAMEEKVGDAETTWEQAELSLANQLFSIAAVEDGHVVGIARLMGDRAIYWYINDVWVLPEYRGKGIGKAMVERLIAYVKASGIPGTSISLCLMCAKGKEGFYEKLGFLRRPHEWEGAGMEMELTLE